MEAIQAVSEEDTGRSIPPSTLDIPPVTKDSMFPTTPSMGTSEDFKLSEEVNNEEDICGKATRSNQTNGGVENDCEFNKKRMWCATHECGLKSNKVSSKVWQYSKSKLKYMYVSKRVLKYVCLSKCGSRVQPKLTEVTGRIQTKPEAEFLRESNGSSNDDYSGAVIQGSDWISNSAGK